MDKQEIVKRARELIDGVVKGTFERIEANIEHETPYESTFLGSIIRNSPSGKLYTPWAFSNVTECPRCHWAGCDFCGGLGSREAYEDQIWQEALEEYAGTLDCWIEPGEGSFDDLFLARNVKEGHDESEANRE